MVKGQSYEKGLVVKKTSDPNTNRALVSNSKKHATTVSAMHKQRG